MIVHNQNGKLNNDVETGVGRDQLISHHSSRCKVEAQGAHLLEHLTYNEDDDNDSRLFGVR